MESINQVLKDYKLQVQCIESTDLSKLKNINAGIQLSVKAMFDLRLLVRSNNYFANKEDEIQFFKYTKPFISGRLKFFGGLHKFALKCPKVDVRNQKKYIRAELKRLDDHKIENFAFWKYIKNKQSQKDDFYFLRSNYQIGVDIDIFNFDSEFSTNYGNLMAQFVASDLLAKHYKRQLLKLGSNIPDPSVDLIINANRSWSGSKTDLIELIYAIHASGVINNGHVEISKMIQVSEKFFNIKLGNPYKTFIEIKAREKDRTKFLDTLKFTLLAKMDVDDAIGKS